MNERGGFSHIVYPTERCCQNCVSHLDCWGTDLGWLPRNFIARPGWSSDRMSVHLKRVYGGMCADYGPSNVPTLTQLAKTEKGWDI